MRNLSRYRWNNRTEVKFLQAWLNQFENEELSVDGDYGNKSVLAVKRYQKKYHLTEDGYAGQITLNSMGFKTTRNKNIVVLKILFNKLDRGKVLWEDGTGRSPKYFADKYKYDIVWNGAYFQNSNKQVCQLMMIDGEVKHWGMGYEGIAYGEDGQIKAGHLDNFKNQNYDMQGSAPTLIENYGTDEISINAFSAAIMRSKTRRNCTAVTDDAIWLFFSIANQTLYQMKDEGLYQKVKFMQNNDGGGSQWLYMGGAYVITSDGRTVPACVGLRIRSLQALSDEPIICPTCKQEVADGYSIG